LPGSFLHQVSYLICLKFGKFTRVGSLDFAAEEQALSTDVMIFTGCLLHLIVVCVVDLIRLLATLPAVTLFGSDRT